MKSLKILSTILLLGIPYVKTENKKNVVIIMADDLGFNDVSYHGSTEIPTYNIDALAYSGIILNNYRTPAMCTPSRSALMTGKYPQHLGMQNLVIQNDEPWGLPLNEKILPQYFKEAGYTTRLVGKWHLGFYQEQYMPTNRGFDSHYGYLGSWIDYWDYTHDITGSTQFTGYDMRQDLSVARKDTPKYVTDLLTDEAVRVIGSHDKSKPLFMLVSHLAPHAGNDDDPLQAKESDYNLFGYIQNESRRKLAAMVHSLDQSVGAIVKAISDNNMLDNTIILFYVDNGSATVGVSGTTASNYPLRGQKISGWEGGIRVPAIIYSKSLPQSVVRNNMIYVADLLPTLSTLTGANFHINTTIDGLDQTQMLMQNNRVIRSELVTIDDMAGYASLISGNYKLLVGTTVQVDGAYDTWLGSNNNSNIINFDTYVKNIQESVAYKALKANLKEKDVEKLRDSAIITCDKSNGPKGSCDLRVAPCLFDISKDPCEEDNIADKQKNRLDSMIELYNQSFKTLVSSNMRPADINSNPIFFNNAWSPWQVNSVI